MQTDSFARAGGAAVASRQNVGGQEWKDNWEKMETGKRVWRVEASAKTRPGRRRDHPRGSAVLSRALPQLWMTLSFLPPLEGRVAWCSYVWRLCEFGVPEPAFQEKPQLGFWLT